MNRHNAEGSVLVEFALVVPIIWLLFGFIVDAFTILHIKARLARCAYNEGIIQSYSVKNYPLQPGRWFNNITWASDVTNILSSPIFGFNGISTGFNANPNITVIVTSLNTGYVSSQGSGTVICSTNIGYTPYMTSSTLSFSPPNSAPPQTTKITGLLPALSNSNSNYNFTKTYTTIMVEIFYKYKSLTGVIPDKTVYSSYCIDSRY